MAITVLQLMAKVGIDTKEAEAGLAAVSGAGNVMSKGLLLGAGAAAVAVVGIGVAATKMAGDFQAQSETLVTGAGLAQGSLETVRQGILAMARDTGESTQQLISGMFMISSAGKLAAAPLDILRAAAEGAKVGNADLGTTADALTTILKDFPKTANGASGAMNILIATVASGKTHMQDLAGALSGVLPTAASAGVGLNSVMAAMATMTAQGTPAANAATYLRQLMIALSAPSKQAADTLAQFGLTSKQVADAMRQSLPSALELIQTAVEKKFPVGSAAYIAAMKDIAGGSRQMQGILQLTGSHLQEFTQDTTNMGKAAQQGGNQITGWKAVQGEFNTQVSRAKEVVETLMISLGQKLLPAGTAVFGFLANQLIPTIANFVTWVTGSSTSANIFKGMLLGVAIAIGGALIPVMWGWATAAWGAAAGMIAATWPILAVGVAIGGLILLLKYAYDHWTGFRNVVNHIPPILGAVKDAIGWVIGRLGDLLGVLGHVKDAIAGAFGGLGNLMGKIGSIHIPGLAGGTSFAPGGLAVVGERGPELVNLPQGSQVIPLPSGLSGAGAGGGSGGGGTVVVQLKVDGRTLAQTVVPHLHTVIRNATGQRGM